MCLILIVSQLGKKVIWGMIGKIWTGRGLLVFLGVVTQWLCRTRALFLRVTCSVVFSVEVKCLDVYNFQIAQKNTHGQMDKTSKARC